MYSTYIKKTVHKDGTVSTHHLNTSKEAYKLLYRYETWRAENVSNSTNKRSTIIDFLETL